MNLDIKQELRDAGDDGGAPSHLDLAGVMARGRRRRHRRAATLIGGAGAVAVLAVSGVSLLLPQGEPDVPQGKREGSTSCVAVLDFRGHHYVAHGELKTTPPTTGRTESARVPRCDDGNGAVSGFDVEVEELVGVPMSQAVLTEYGLYLADGAKLTNKLRAWFRSPTCDHEGTVTMVGRWYGVTSNREVRFDGDIRPPLRISFAVQTTDPQTDRYDGWEIRIRDTGAADPALTTDDVKRAVWSDALLEVKVHCVGKDFRAEAFRVLP